MSIDFSALRWEKVRLNSDRWWSGELDRPLVQLVMRRASDRGPSAVAGQHSLPNHPASVTPEQIVDRWDYELSCERYLGDAFPARWVDFGAGVLAALLGCELRTAPDTVWFHSPGEGRADWSLADVRFDFDPDNPWLRRIEAIMRAANERFVGRAQIGMTDLGGTLDVLSSFRPGEQLLTDVVDDPATVEKLAWEIHGHWWNAFHRFEKLLGNNRGWTCWTPIFSSKPYYMLQCDFCYMIGPKMFDRLVLPELAASCRRIPRPFYHLDGVGEIPHLDSILSIRELKGVQWIPGDGKPHAGHWPEVLRKIRAAGKLVQFYGDPEVLEMAADVLGSAKGLCLISHERYPEAQEDRLRRFLERFNIPA